MGLLLAAAQGAGCESFLESRHATFDAGAGDPIQQTPIAFAQYLKAPQPQAEARFGSAIRMNETGLAVAASFEDVVLATGVNVEDGGAVYVFDLYDLSAAPLRFVAPNVDPGDGQVPIEARPPPLPQLSPWPGIWMDLDQSFVVVGVAGEDSAKGGDPLVAGLDNSAREAGAVYVYQRRDPAKPPQYIKAPYPDAADLFGESLALSAAWLAIGASGDDSASAADLSLSGAADSGVVYLYRLQEGDFVLRQTLKAPTVHAGERFGNNVMLQGDVLVVGAPAAYGSTEDEASGASPSGALYVYRLARTPAADEWRFVARIATRAARAAGLFGGVLALDGQRIAVGTPGAPCPGADTPGVAYVIEDGGDGLWSTQACLDGAPPSLFGTSTALFGDHMLVGAPWDASARPDDPSDVSLGFAGAAYLYRREGQDVWQRRAYLKAPNLDSGDVFGVSVGLSPGWLAVGAEQESGGQSGPQANLDDDSAHYAGAVYLYRSEELTK